MTGHGPTVFLVDDDPSVMHSLEQALRATGYSVEAYAAADIFLTRVNLERPGCIVLDLRIPEVGGLGLQAELARRGCPLPIVFLSSDNDVPSSVRAMKAGAVDFLSKPVDEQDLLAAVERALARDAEARAARAKQRELQARFAALTAREQEVCLLVVQGLLNKQIAAELGTAEKTIKVHRGRVMAKLGVMSIADLVRFVDRVRGE